MSRRPCRSIAITSSRPARIGENRAAGGVIQLRSSAHVMIITPGITAAPMTSPLLPLHPTRTSVLLAVVLVALWWAGSATAGCGDHVVILKPAGAKTADDTPPSTIPCRGPHCSADPVNPLPAPVTSGVVTPSTAKEQFTTLGTITGDDRQVVVGRPFEFTSPRPIDRASAIFHPPRG